jgi:hypothetical protein
MCRKALTCFPPRTEESPALPGSISKFQKRHKLAIGTRIVKCRRVVPINLLRLFKREMVFALGHVAQPPTPNPNFAQTAMFPLQGGRHSVAASIPAEVLLVRSPDYRQSSLYFSNAFGCPRTAAHLTSVHPSILSLSRAFAMPLLKYASACLGLNLMVSE